jgi:hypothetical protein
MEGDDLTMRMHMLMVVLLLLLLCLQAAERHLFWSGRCSTAGACPASSSTAAAGVYWGKTFECRPVCLLVHQAMLLPAATAAAIVAMPSVLMLWWCANFKYWAVF